MDVRWTYFGLTATFFDTKASWLAEARSLHWRSLAFFRVAGKLVSLSRDDYELSTVAFYQAVFGLEVALRLHYASRDGSFAKLFKKAITECVVTDTVFSEVRRLSAGMLLSESQLRDIERKASSHCEALSVLVPELRNRYVHGNHAISSEYIHLTMQMRELVDALDTKNARPMAW